jgi:hypothetical protein
LTSTTALLAPVLWQEEAFDFFSRDLAVWLVAEKPLFDGIESRLITSFVLAVCCGSLIITGKLLRKTLWIPVSVSLMLEDFSFDL